MANSLDAFVPEVWAAESLSLLEKNMVLPQLVYRGFETAVASFGDVVNTRLPAEFIVHRKVDGDAITNQDASATNVAMTLNQHAHVSFIIYDGEESKSFQTLVETYLVPAMLAMSEFYDQVVAGEVYNFLANCVGGLQQNMTAQTLIDAHKMAADNKWPNAERFAVLCPEAEADMLAIDTFIEADKVGDDGTALREASLGRKYGFNVLMSQNIPAIATGSTVVTGAVNNAAGYGVGDTAITVDGLSAAITAGSWCTIAGDNTPQLITGSTGGATPTAIAISPGLRSAVVDNAVLKIYTPGAINLAAGYAANYAKPLVVDAFTVAPKRGQMCSFGATSAYVAYSALNTPTTTALSLNRGLDAAVVDNAVVALGPPGNYNFAFQRNAIALISRPPVPVREGTGARSAVLSLNGIGVRVTISYDSTYQGHRVTVDSLLGVKTIRTALGIPMLS